MRMTSTVRPHSRAFAVRCGQTIIVLAIILLVALQGQTRIDLTQLRLPIPSVTLIQRAICVEQAPITGSDCSLMELYTLSFSDGSQRIMIGIPDDGTISKSVKWVPVPITPPGT